MRKFNANRFLAVLTAPIVLTLIAAPQSGATTASAEYVSMGSSFAAGPGIPSPLPDSPPMCARSDHNYANIVARDLGKSLADVGCSGAVTANVVDTPQGDQPPQVEAVGAETTAVTVTIGGNDVNYLGSLGTYSCMDTGGANCGTVDQSGIDKTFNDLQGRLERVVNAVHDKSPNAKVFLLQYLTIVPPGSACDGVPLTDDQLTFERSIASRLADFTSAAAANTGATLVKVAEASATHDSCSSEPWVEKYSVPEGRTAYHPNEAGMAAVADLVKSAFADEGV